MSIENELSASFGTWTGWRVAMRATTGIVDGKVVEAATCSTYLYTDQLAFGICLLPFLSFVCPCFNEVVVVLRVACVLPIGRPRMNSRVDVGCALLM